MHGTYDFHIISIIFLCTDFARYIYGRIQRTEIYSKYRTIVDEDRSITYGASLALSIAITPIIVESFMKSTDYNDAQLAIITTALSFGITSVLKMVLKSEYQDVFKSVGSYIFAVIVCVLFLCLLKDTLKNPELTIISSIIGSIISFIGPLKLFNSILDWIKSRD